MSDYSAHDLVVNAYQMGWHDRHAEKDCDPGDALDMLSDLDMAAGGWTPVMEARPLALDALAAAWEAAEVPTDDNPIREGDLCCVLMSGTWIIGEVGEQWSPDPCSDARILSRAPREPWQDLADVIEAAYQDTGWSESYDDLASALHAAGVRVTGGDGE